MNRKNKITNLKAVVGVCLPPIYWRVSDHTNENQYEQKKQIN